MEAGPRITDWAQREPDVFMGRRADDGRGPDGNGEPADRRRGERRQGERRALGHDNAWIAMGLPERRAAL